MNFKTFFSVSCFLVALLHVSAVMAVPIITEITSDRGFKRFQAQEEEMALASGRYYFWVEVDDLTAVLINGGFSGNVHGFDISGHSSGSQALPGYSSSSSYYRQFFSITNTSDSAKAFGFSMFMDPEMASAQAGNEAYHSGHCPYPCCPCEPSYWDSALFDPATHSIITSFDYEPTIVFATRVNTSLDNGIVGYAKVVWDEAEMAVPSMIGPLSEPVLYPSDDIAIGLGYNNMFVDPGESFTITYDYLICTDTSGDTCGLTAPVPEASALLLLSFGSLQLLLGAVFRKKQRFATSPNARNGNRESVK